MTAYVVAEVDVTDPEAYRRYAALTSETVSRHGGRFIVRGGTTDPLEGEAPKRIVVIEFASLDAARSWYRSADYTAARLIRERAAKSRLFLVEGTPP